MNITYEDFEKAAKGRGLFERFSDFDLKLARENPDAGMQILNYKTDYYAATTDEARAMANQGAEAVRKQYGGYTGGVEGDWYYKEPVSDTTSSFSHVPNTYDEETKKTVEAIEDYGSFSYDKRRPTYKDPYGGDLKKIGEDIINRKAFSYDAAKDPSFAQYKKQYTREGRRATEDTMGIAAAMTGGIPSSYAMTAAAQAGNQYAAALSDKIPELYNAAYNRYVNEHNMKLSDLDAVMALDKNAYQKYMDADDRWVKDRAFDYGVFQDGRSDLYDKLDMYTGLGKDEYERFTGERAYKLDEAYKALEFGDLEPLQKLGFDTSRIEAQYGREEAAAKLSHAMNVANATGDTSEFEALGYDASYIKKLLGLEVKGAELDYAKDVYDATGNNSLLQAVINGNGGGGETLPIPEPQTQPQAEPQTVENTVLPNATVANWAEKINRYVAENYDGQQGMKKMAEGQYEPDFASMEFIIGQVDAAKDLTPEQKVYLLKKLGIDVEDQKVADIIMQRQLDASARRQ